MMIRLLEMKDFHQMLALWNDTPGVGVSDRDDSPEGIEKFLERNPGLSYVAEKDGRIVGTILCGHDGRRATVYHLAVSPGFRGRGIATQLVGSVISALKREGIGKVKAIVFADNAVGNAFWESVGWSLREDLHYFDISV